MAPVAGLGTVLADPDLVPEDMPDDASRDGHALRREIGLAVSPDEEHAGMERLSLGRPDPVHENPLALLDAVLLAADGHDCVAHEGHDRRMRTFVRRRIVAHAGETGFRARALPNRCVELRATEPKATGAGLRRDEPSSPITSREGAGQPCSIIPAARRRSELPLACAALPCQPLSLAVYNHARGSLGLPRKASSDMCRLFLLI